MQVKNIKSNKFYNNVLTCKTFLAAKRLKYFLRRVRMKRLYLDYAKCIGCRLCELACSAEKEKVYNPYKARIRSERIGLPEQVTMAYCHHCDDPACMVCPVDAMSIDENGIVVIDEKECIGCGQCVDSCPAAAIFWRVAEGETAVKCDLCAGSPKCMEVCPRDAILYGDYPQEELLPPRKLAAKHLKEKGIDLGEFEVSQND